MAGAINQDGPVLTFYANDDLSSYQWHIVEMLSTGYVDLGTDPDDADNNLVFGVLENKPNAAGEEALVRVSGVAKVMSGTTITPGKRVTCDGNGHAAIAEAFDNVIGIALTTGASGALMEVLMTPCAEGFPDG